MTASIKKNNFKTAFLLILLAVFISCSTTLKANDLNATDFDNFNINEDTERNLMSEGSAEVSDTTENENDFQKSKDDYFSYPLETKNITSYFGNRRNPIDGSRHFHDGIDFSTPIGETVMAAMDGIVSVAVYHRQHGNYIIINHSNGYRTLYSHLNSFSVQQGDDVKRGQKIGESGNTGNSTGPHLHFGLYNTDDQAINPLEFLKEQE